VEYSWLRTARARGKTGEERHFKKDGKSKLSFLVGVAGRQESVPEGEKEGPRGRKIGHVSRAKFANPDIRDG